MTQRAFLVSVVVVGLGLSCGPGLPASWTLKGTNITVEVTQSPYGYTVRDGTGKAVLSTVGGGAADGWGSLGWTTGQAIFGVVVTQGYQSFDAPLDPWRDRFTVSGAVQTGDTELTLTLTDASPERRTVHVTHKLRASTLRVEASVDGEKPRAWSTAFKSPQDERFLGLGERYNRTEHRGHTVYAWPEEGGLSKGEKEPVSLTNPWPNGEAMTYYPVPFMLSTKGYAFWLDSTWRNQMDFALAPEHADAWRAWHIGPTLAYEVYVPLGETDKRTWPLQLIDLFTATTGRPMIPPAWSFGPRRRTDPGDMQGGVSEIQAMRDLDLAITIVDENTHFLPNAGEVGKETQLRAYIAEATRLGYRVAAYFNPYFASETNPLTPEIQKALDNHWFLRDANGVATKVWLISGRPLSVYTVDFSSAAATAWYQKTFQRALDLGYTGFMYDFGEYVQPGDVAANGMTGEEYHNLFPVQYQKAAHDILEAGPLKGDWYFWARSGYTGSQQWTPMVWSGDPDASFSDAEGLPAQVRAGINIGVSGVAHWGSDIGGFKCLADGGAAADGELLTRWIEFGAMCSNMHDEDACAGNMDGKSKATIWSSPEAMAAWKRYARLHSRMLPYLLGLAAEAHARGAPLVRHLFLEHPDRPDLAAVDDAFYFGPSLLVAPVVKRGARSRTLELPKGSYLDWRDDESKRALLAGGQTVTLDAPLADLPLLLRDGQLLPLLDPTIDTLDVTSDHVAAGVIGPAEVAGVLDVVGLVSTSAGAARFTLADGTVLAATWKGGFAAPALAAAASEAELSTCAACWRMDAAAGGMKRVRISATGAVTAGGLELSAMGGTGAPQRLRWELYLVE